VQFAGTAAVLAMGTEAAPRPKTADNASRSQRGKQFTRKIRKGSKGSIIHSRQSMKGSTTISRIEAPGSLLLPPKRQKGLIHSIYNDNSSKHLTGSELVNSLERSV
jgi:hypothetical protein